MVETKTRTASQQDVFEHSVTETAPGLRRPLAEEGAASEQRFQYARPPYSQGQLWSSIGRFVIAVGVSTSPIIYSDPRQDLRRSLASSVAIVSKARRRGRVLSLENVWVQVGRVFAEADERRTLQRRREFLELAWYTVDDDA